MQTYYQHYLLGCRQSGVKPLSVWRFSIAYGKYRREFRRALDERVDLLPEKGRERIVGRWTRLVRLAELVECGQQIAEAARRGEDDAGAAGAGAREPRTPLTPVLVGGASRALPTDDASNTRADWRF